MAVSIIQKDITPVCPYCEKEVEEVVEASRQGVFVVTRIYCCPHCHKILSIASNS